ncbi:phospholipase [Viscerimonas tarda]
MELLFIFLAIVAFFVVSLFVWNTIQQKRGNTGKPEDVLNNRPEDGECCGQHAVCEKELLIKSYLSKEIEYFDDEELDTYINRPSDCYTEEEVEEFREVLYSMYDDDKPKWVRSLQRRGIAIPNQLKDEIILTVT